VLQCVAVWYCSVSQSVAIRCRVLHCGKVWFCSVSQCVAIRFGVLQCVAVVLQYDAT